MSSTGQAYWKQKFNFFKDDLGGDALSVHLLLSLAIMNSNTSTRMKRASFQKLVSLFQDHPVFYPLLDAHWKDENNLHQHFN